MPTSLLVPVTRPFDSAGELSSLAINNGWSVSGGNAVSSATTMAGTTRRFMLDAGTTWAGTVEADIAIQDGVGLCLGVPSSNPDNGTGVYFGIFYDSETGGHTFRLWLENTNAQAANRNASDCDFRVETRCWLPAGTVATFVLAARGSGWAVRVNGKDILWLKSYSRVASLTLGARLGTYLGAWATRSGATVARLKTAYARNRGAHLTKQTMFYDQFTQAAGQWNPALASPTPAQAPISAPGTSTLLNVNASQQLVNTSFNSSMIQVLGGDSAADDMRQVGVVYYVTFKYVSGPLRLNGYFSGGTHYLAINSSASGSLQGLAYAGSDGKGSLIWNAAVASLYATGTYFQIRYYVPYDAAANQTSGDFAPYGSIVYIQTLTSTSINGPWTQQLLQTDSSTGGSFVSGYYSSGIYMASSDTSTPLVIDDLRLERGPIQDLSAGNWPYDHTQPEGPGDFGINYSTYGRPAFLFTGADRISQLVEAN